MTSPPGCAAGSVCGPSPGSSGRAAADRHARLTPPSATSAGFGENRSPPEGPRWRTPGRAAREAKESSFLRTFQLYNMQRGKSSSVKQ